MTNIQWVCSPWRWRCIPQPPINMVRLLEKSAASCLIVSAGTPQIFDAHSAVFGWPSVLPNKYSSNLA